MRPLKHCEFCGRFFRPDPRIGDAQRSCFREDCKKKRKRKSHKKWVKSNPGYYKGRYDNTKAWREANPGRQKEWRAKKRREIQDAILKKSSVKTIRLAVPVKVLQSEIQDEIRLVRQCGCGFWLGGAGTRDTRRDSHPAPY